VTQQLQKSIDFRQIELYDIHLRSRKCQIGIFSVQANRLRYRYRYGAHREICGNRPGAYIIIGLYHYKRSRHIEQRAEKAKGSMRNTQKRFINKTPK
jgi:hypothetical protein